MILNPGVGGWPATDSTGGWGSTSAAVSTNPFGTSPSGPPAHFNKPPLSGKPISWRERIIDKL